MDKIGLIAGYGKLPLIWSREAFYRDIKVHTFLISEEFNQDFRDYTETTDYLSLTELDKLIRKLKEYKINKIIMLGKVNKKYLYKKNNFDQRFIKLLKDCDNLEDHSILTKLVAEFNKEGFEVLKQSTFLDKYFLDEGLLNNITADKQLLEEMRYAFKKAKQIANLEIGQTVITNNKAVVAVETIEGTDRTIKRAGNLVESNAVMAKASKNNHDFRFDIPTIGPNTINNLISIKARGLALEKNRILVIEKDKLIKLADKAELSIISFALKED